MRYLKKTQNLGLHYNKFPVVLEGYNDDDWNSLSDDSKAISDYICNIVGGDVAWKSKKHTILARDDRVRDDSTSCCSEEASWLRSLLLEIFTWERPIPAILIHCDSTAAITKVQNRYYKGKRRQICRKHSTIRELLTTSAMIVNYVRSDDNLANPLTKGLAREKVFKTSERMGLKPIKT
ncbi:hypothetical protein IC582_008049 [Cucumis melo]